MALGILTELEKDGKIPHFTVADHNSSKYLHAVIQALRIAFADGSWYITDPKSAVSPGYLISQPYLAQRAKLFDPARSTDVADPGDLGGMHKISDTVYLCVTDAEGNACSLVNSVSDNFGSRIIPPGTGVFGVMGGAMQPQGHVQVLMNMLRFGMNPQVALDAPRICIGVSLPGKSTDPSKTVDRTVYIEEGIGANVVCELEEMGHEVKIVRGMDRSLFGRGQIIRVHHDPTDDFSYATLNFRDENNLEVNFIRSSTGEILDSLTLYKSHSKQVVVQ
ncbi:putative gamma-glutamyltranspeptidase [Diaporthe ampelina]|uniref:Putative gamma-glutamyltranspeptidase n=1 Tax=Diaporthe ampelina TaxID=1214573 RepID=A0A0G2HMN7_9PEZI|nr:putative gamma-glutamyltranspeptidase [Diaporthe ampelina]